MENLSKINSLYGELALLTRQELRNLENVILYERKDNEDFDNDGIYDLPRCYDVSKHGYYSEYAIIKIEKKENDIIEIHTIDLGEENFGEDRIFNEYILDALQIVDLLNYIEETKIIKEEAQKIQVI